MSDEFFESYPPSPTRGVLALVPQDPEWQPIFHVSNQVVLYNPTSHALSIRQSNNFPSRHRPPCPYCKQTLPMDFEGLESGADDILHPLDSDDPAYHSRASDYFQLLANANESSTHSTPHTIADTSQDGQRSTFPAEAMAEGYFKTFFQEEYKLGMGANGSVFLCQVRFLLLLFCGNADMSTLACVGREPFRFVFAIRHTCVLDLIISDRRPFCCQKDRSWRITFVSAEHPS
jgi:hypothetical protein